MANVTTFPRPRHPQTADDVPVQAEVVSSPAQPPRSSALSGSSTEVYDVWWVISILRRRIKTIAIIVLLIPLVTLVYVRSLPKIYAADTRLLIEAEQKAVVDIQSVARGIGGDSITIQTEAQYIASREMALRTVDMLDLTARPFFNPTLPHAQLGTDEKPVNWAVSQIKDLLATAKATVTGAWSGLFGHTDAMDEETLVEAAEPSDPREVAAAILLSNLIVEASRVARVISIEFRSTDPLLAAEVSNGVAEAYLEDNRERREASIRRASAWLTGRVAQLRQSVIEAETELEKFRRDNGLVEVGGSSLLRQQIAQLTQRQIVTEAERAEVEARYFQVRGFAENPDRLETLDSALKSDLITNLRRTENDIVQRIGEMQTRYGSQHPDMKRAREELQQVRQSIRAEVRRIADSLRNEVQVARAREDSLQNSIDRLQQELDAKAGAEARLRSLESEVEASRDIYELILNRLRETDVEDGEAKAPEARIITRAVVPKSPVAPRVNVSVLASTLGAFALAVIVAMTLELAIRGFRSLHQLEIATGLPVLVQLPEVLDLKKNDAVVELLANRPGSSFSQALRRLRATIQLITGYGSVRVVMVSSTVASEGKSSTALGLAVISAASGARVCIVDADAQNPSLHRKLNVPNTEGLSDYLVGNAELDAVTEFDPQTGIYYLVQGGPLKEPDQMYAGERMQDLIKTLRRNFDLVLIDTAPVSAVGDPLVLAPQVDSVIYVVQWEGPGREVVIQNLREIYEIAENIVGLILTRVDSKHQALAKGVEYYYEAD